MFGRSTVAETCFANVLQHSFQLTTTLQMPTAHAAVLFESLNTRV